MSEKIVRIGGASAFWGDSAAGPLQLATRGDVDYLVFDYLAELTMSLLAGARARDPRAGYATDFVHAVKSILPEIAAKRIRIVSNAGGVNPQACADAVAAVAHAAGIELKIAVVLGDDLMGQIEQLRPEAREIATGASLPENLLSANAYLGAFPIAHALARGADIVISGRAVDSASTLGVLIHEFGWRPDEYDLLAAGSLAGHILECACQATGGLSTDWEAVERWEDIGYPIALCRADGSFRVAKPKDTGGRITPLGVAEQLLYEIGDPARYLLPDVSCDFTRVTMTPDGSDRVRVSGARGAPPSGRYKVSATYPDGFRSVGTLTIIGIDAARKARRTAKAILARTRAMFRAANLGDYRAAEIEILGAESIYGPHARAGAQATREAVMRLAVWHDDKRALELFAREVAPSGTSWSPGTTGIMGRPQVFPCVRLFSFMVPQAAVHVRVAMDGAEKALPAPGAPAPAAPAELATPVAAVAPKGRTTTVPLVALACGRSGDKGDTANIGIIARRPEFLPLLRHAVTPEVVKGYFAHLVTGKVERFDLPGIGAMNFLMHGALGGGGMASLRNDPLGKGMAQMLLDLPVEVPEAWLESYGLASFAAVA